MKTVDPCAAAPLPADASAPAGTDDGACATAEAHADEPCTVDGSVFLVGMMGAGKTSVGRLLAQRLGKRFIDADHEIEARCGVTIPVIFEIEGEAGFRQRERQVIDELTTLPDIVLATGGGAVLSEDSRRRMHDRGLVIYLKASATEIWHRTRRDRTRPLLATRDPQQRIIELLAAREPLYAETAHVTIESTHESVKSMVTRLIERLNERRSPDGNTPAQPAGAIAAPANGLEPR
jgi:shikimate kinase